jgi:hypothetical protein
MQQENFEPYINLANAIVKEAAKEYVSALRKLKRNRGNQAAMKEAMELEQFFYSQDFALLTSLDPDYLIQKLREKVCK